MFVTISSKAEGSGPLSVLRLAEAIVATQAATGPTHEPRRSDHA